MKHLNRVGPPPPDRRTPRRLDAQTLRRIFVPTLQIVDTRSDRQAFFASHFSGAFHVPLDRTFPTTAGSLLDPDVPIVLVADERNVDLAVRQLQRIGYDDLLGWAGIDVLDHPALAHLVVSTESIDITALSPQAPGLTVLDVRTASEYAACHLPGALNVAHTRLRAELPRLMTHGGFAVHCATGARAAAAVSFLEHHGVAAVHVEGDVIAARPGCVTAQPAGAGQK